MYIDADLWADVHNSLISCVFLCDAHGNNSLGDKIMGILSRFDSAYIDQALKPSSAPSDSPAAQETSNPPATK